MGLNANRLSQQLSRKLVRQARVKAPRERQQLHLHQLEDRLTPTGTISGIVFVDYGANGQFDSSTKVNNAVNGQIGVAGDIGLANVTVNAYVAGSSVPVGTTTTNGSGAYTLNAGGTGPYRIEFVGLPTGNFYGMQGSAPIVANSSNTVSQFVPDGNSNNINLAVSDPETITGNVPTLAVTVSTFGAYNDPNNLNNSAIVDVPYTAGTEDADLTRANYLPPQSHTLNIRHRDVGSVWGLAYDRANNDIYTSAFMKRHSGFGQFGPGAIYRFDANYVRPNPNDPGPQPTPADFLYVDLNQVFASDPQPPAGADFRGPGNNYVTDGLAGNVGWDSVGKISLGGLEASPDGRFLYTVSLADKRLYIIPTSGPLNSTTIQRINIPRPAGVAEIDFRPFAVSYHEGRIHVGAVNSAESTQNRSDLAAYVFAFDIATNAFLPNPVLNFPLNYTRGNAHPGDNTFDDNGGNDDVSANWLPWSPVYRNLTSVPAGAQANTAFRGIYPQPWLTGISFDAEGNMHLAIRDRAGDQFGRFTPSDPSNVNALTFAFGVGDLLKAFANTPGNVLNGWTLESNGNGGSGVGNGQGPGGGEFFGQDNLPQSTTAPRVNPSEHDEVASGAVLALHGFPDVVYTTFDPERIPFAFNSAGLRWASNTTGQNTKGYQLYFTETTAGVFTPPATFAKGNGLGDLIALTTTPVEVGNFVWFDTNGDGIQDPGETPLSNINVQLWGAGTDGTFGTGDDTQIGSVNTDASGNFYFSNGLGTSTGSKQFGVAMVPATPYQIRVPLGQPALNNRPLTLFQAGNIADPNRVIRDSDAKVGAGTLSSFAVVGFTSPDPGVANHTLDIGFTKGPTYSIGDTVWEDANNDGIFQSGTEAGLDNVTVELLDGSSKVIASQKTAGGGKYLFADLDPSKYQVRIVASTLPTGYISSTGTVGSLTGPFEPATGGAGNEGQDHGTDTGNGFITAPAIQLVNANILTQDFGFFRPLSVGNFVWLDANNSGTLDGTEKGVQGIGVDLLDGVGGKITSTTTDTNGNYLFTNLVPGKYQVRITTPAGFVSSTGKHASASGPYEPGISTDIDDQDHGTQSTATTATASIITLTAPGTNVDSNGTANLRQDFGIFQPLSIGDTVWLDANNNGKFDGAESGLGNVTVNLRDGNNALVATTTTNASGGYLFGYLQPGSYRVEVVNASLPAGLASSTGTNGSATGPFEPAPGNTEDGFDVGTTNGAVTQGTLVTLALGGAPLGEAATPGGIVDVAADANSNRRQDFGFFRPLAIGNLVWNDLDNNGKFDGAEIGLNGILVDLLDAGNNVIAKTTTAGNGAYLFDNLIAGDYRVRVTPPAGFTSSTGTTGSPIGPYEPGVTGLQDNEDHGTTTGAFVQASLINLANAANLPDLGGRANLRQDFGLFQAYSIGDQIWFDANNNGKFDAGEKGIQDVVVNLLSGNTVVGTTQTDGNGNYGFGGLNAGKFQVQVVTPAGLISSTGVIGSATGPYEPGVSGIENNEDHGTASGSFTIGGIVNLGVPAETPDGGGFANLRQDFGFFRPLSLGNAVWVDTDNDGLFDATESGKDGVTVDLLDGGGATVATTTTANGGQYLFSNLTGQVYQVRVNPPAGYSSSTGKLASPIGPYEPGTALNNDNEDHGTQTGAVILGPQVDLANAANLVDTNGTANLRQDFGIYQPLSIGNFVWDDANNNGKFDAGEKPLGNLPVDLLDAGNNVIGSTTTDANGNYLFGQLIPGDYRVQVTPGGKYVSSTGTNGSASGPYEPGVTGTQDDEDHGTQNGAAVRGGLVTLGLPGDTTANPDATGRANFRQDFGLFQPLSLGNLVWLDVDNSGTLNGTEAGLPNIAVRLLDANGVQVGTQSTDANGKYLFSNLTPGKYSVEITPSGTLVSSSGKVGSLTGPFEPAPITGPDNADHGTTVGAVIRANDIVLGTPGDTTANPTDNGFSNTTIDFGLLEPPPANAKVSGYVFVDPPITGIREPGKRPIPGTRITLTGTDTGGNAVSRTTFTDTTGFYQFTDLPPGTYTITETQPAGILFDGLDKSGSLGGTVSNDKLTVTLANGDEGIEYNFSEIPPAQVFGFVYEDLNRNNRFDPGEPPIANTKIAIEGTAFANSVLSRPLTAADSKTGLFVTTDQNGRWEFFGLPPGNYTLRESQPAGYADLNESVEDKQALPVTISNDIFGSVLAPASTTRGALNFGEIRQDRVDPTKREFLGSTDTTPNNNGGGANANVRTSPTFPLPGSGTAADPTLVAIGAGAGRAPFIRVFDYTAGIERYSFLAYESTFTGGVRVALGDVNGDGIDDIVTGTGIGGGPRVIVFSGADGSVLSNFFAYEPTFRGGIFVAAADLDGDGRADIITGTESGGGPRVSVFSGADGSVLRNFFAFDPNQRGGVRVGAGDVNNDGRDDLIAATGPGVVTRVRTFDGKTNTQLADFTPFGAAFTSGAYVAGGRLAAGAADSVIVTPEGPGAPNVATFNGTTGAAGLTFAAYEAAFRGGVRVAAHDINGDGVDDIVTVPGPGGAARVRIFNGVAPNAELDSWFNFDTTFTGGSFAG